ncbi:hypothetical protein G3576_15570 [Roseomonas stagni]|uniref:Uncharacterized protein n=1 Tax=Falsiroseomonas algicola TaxID=2716930 RepID=A0A6M1LMZ8_9PROT|nr:hypothetical protein [Falsiroseomonas algicola]NGM21442.1 hypothetical protein [Falsiroseomonas algicola]
MLAGSPLLLAGCIAPTADQQASAFTPTSTAVAARARQSRRFDTTDQAMMMQAALGALQDLGFTIEESQADAGVIVGSKVAGGRIRAQVSVRRVPAQPFSVVRATFQRIVPRPGAMLALGETLDDPLLYQGFFDRIAQSAFLTAHEI